MTTATLPRPCRPVLADASPVAAARRVPVDLGELAAAIAADGIERHEGAVARTVAEAQAAQLSPVLVDALADRTRTPVLRTRAFGRIALLLAHR